jgi:hypothetical protein
MTDFSGLGFRELFGESYVDAPNLAEDLLFPLLQKGNDIHAVSAFVPSYFYKLFELLRLTDTAGFGLLNISFYVPSDLGIRARALTALVEYFSEYVEFDGQIARFASDGIELAEAGVIRLNITYSKAKRRLARGSAFVVVDGAGREDYVAMVDSKGGDWNSPLVPSRSWDLEQQLNADDVLSQIAKFNHGSNAQFFKLSNDATNSILGETFAVLRQAFESSNSSNKNLRADADEDIELFGDDFSGGDGLGALTPQYFDFDFDEDGRIIEAESLDEFELDDEDAQHIDELLELSDGLRLRVERDDTVNGHAPPLPRYLAEYYPVLIATCICGDVFNRADGCPKFEDE